MGREVVLVVDSRVRLLARDVDEDTERALKALFVHENPEFLKKKRMGLPTYDEPSRYVNWHEAGAGSQRIVSFPRGGLGRVRRALAEHGYDSVIDDQRSDGCSMRLLAKSKADQTIPEHKFDLWPFQREAIDAAIAKQTGLVKSSTGSGKTTIAFGIAARLKLPTLVVVRSALLMQQWRDRAPKELGIPSRKVGTIREGKADLRPLTVAMQQTLAAVFANDPQLGEEIRRTFGVLIYDEVQEAAARTVREVIDPFPARYRIGISADFTRKDRREFLVQDLFDDVAYEAKFDDLVSGGYILDVEVRVVPTDWHTTSGDPVERVEQMTHDLGRDKLIERIVEGEARKNGQQVAVLTHRVEHALRLDARMSAMGFRSGTILGGKPEENRSQATVKGLRDGTVRCASATVQAFGQALDIPALAVGVLATPLSTNKQKFNQAKGRFCRRGKDQARLYVLWDRRVFGMLHLRNLAAWNKRCVVLDDGKWVPAAQYLISRKR